MILSAARFITSLAAAKIAGVDEIYKIGGAQAIAAMAFGTESIPKVDKITGPGNIFVALAKKACFGYVSIDSIAGPSEILVIADETANPRYVAADLLSQAEHDELASAILITTSESLAKEVQAQIDGFLKELSREDIMRKSLENYGYILLADSMDDAVSAANAIASEHLEILTKNPYEIMTRIENAGAIFLGEYSSEPLGDYFAGPNHILPTNGTARFFSPLCVDDFMKKTRPCLFLKAHFYGIGVSCQSFFFGKQLDIFVCACKRFFRIRNNACFFHKTSGIGFFDHMLEGFARHGFFDLTLSVNGDLQVDGHHTVEDTGIVLGQAIKEAAGDKAGMKRYGFFILRVFLRCFVQGLGKCLKHGLYHMMGIFSRKHLNMNVHTRTVGKRVEKFPHKLCFQCADAFCFEIAGKVKIRPAA